MQVGLAEQMAMYDKSINNDSDPKQNVEKYTEGHSWFKHFKKAYIKKWQSAAAIHILDKQQIHFSFTLIDFICDDG